MIEKVIIGLALVTATLFALNMGYVIGRDDAAYLYHTEAMNYIYQECKKQ